jgi:alpha-mannosidase
VLKPGQLGNKLELFEDRPVSWDAWDIDIFFEDRGEVVGGLTRLEIDRDRAAARGGRDRARLSARAA